MELPKDLVPLILYGDVRARLKDLPDECVDCVVTSPPYWGLRDYGTGTWDGGEPECDHVQRKKSPHKGLPDAGANSPTAMKKTLERLAEQEVIQYRKTCGKCGAVRKDLQIGMEATPESFARTLVEVFREVRRVLKPTGTLWLNLGDSYASKPVGSFNGGSSILNGLQVQAHQNSCTMDKTNASGLAPKNLVGIPWRVAFALQADGWWLRSDIIWSKPNPMPESSTDRPSKSHEYNFLLTKRARYFFDADAIREVSITGDQRRPYGSKGAWALDGRPSSMKHGG